MILKHVIFAYVRKDFTGFNSTDCLPSVSQQIDFYLPNPQPMNPPEGRITETLKNVSGTVLFFYISIVFLHICAESCFS